MCRVPRSQRGGRSHHPTVVLRPSGRCRQDPPTGIVECMPRRASSSRSRRVAVLVDRRYLTHDQPAGMCAVLRERGHDIRVVGAEEAFEAGDGTWFEAADLVVSRGRSSELLSLLYAAEQRGLTTFHPATGIAAVQNKARLASRLEAGGVPTLEAAVGNGHALMRFADEKAHDRRSPRRDDASGSPTTAPGDSSSSRRTLPATRSRPTGFARLRFSVAGCSGWSSSASSASSRQMGPRSWTSWTSPDTRASPVPAPHLPSR